jgi:hypothetical protein
MIEIQILYIILSLYETIIFQYNLHVLAVGIRVKIDDRNTIQPGFKFSHWEMKVNKINMKMKYEK